MKLFVIGNCVVDRSYRVQRLPRHGETMIARESQSDFGGKGFNQAVSAARAGAAVVFATSVGDDDQGRDILAALREEGIDVSLASVRSGPTDDAAILVMPDGDNSIVCSIHSALHTGVDLGMRSVAQAGAGDWLVMQGNIDRETTEDTLIAAREKSVRTLVNPSPILFDYTELWPLIDIAIVNELELSDLSGLKGHDEGARRLLDLGCGCVVLTLGAAGARLYHSDRPDAIAVGTPPVTAIDTTGAGDVCCGVFIAALTQGMEAEYALALAVRSAALSVTRLGSLQALPTRKELAELCRELSSETGR